jgi:hypothetical protein
MEIQPREIGRGPSPHGANTGSGAKAVGSVTVKVGTGWRTGWWCGSVVRVRDATRTRRRKEAVSGRRGGAGAGLGAAQLVKVLSGPNRRSGSSAFKGRGACELWSIVHQLLFIKYYSKLLCTVVINLIHSFLIKLLREGRKQMHCYPLPFPLKGRRYALPTDDDEFHLAWHWRTADC